MFLEKISTRYLLSFYSAAAFFVLSFIPAKKSTAKMFLFIAYIISLSYFTHHGVKHDNTLEWLIIRIGCACQDVTRRAGKKKPSKPCGGINKDTPQFCRSVFTRWKPAAPQQRKIKDAIIGKRKLFLLGAPGCVLSVDWWPESARLSSSILFPFFHS